jgi:rare lipoprotein A
LRESFHFAGSGQRLKNLRNGFFSQYSRPTPGAEGDATMNRHSSDLRSAHRFGWWLVFLFLVLLAQGCTALSRVTSQPNAGLLPPPPTQPSFPGKEQNSHVSKAAGPAVVVHTGQASWYGPGFNGKKTASGDIFDDAKLTAAHKTLPLGSKARVRNIKTGESVDVEINDRGPFVDGRSIDLSKAAAKILGILDSGIAQVRIELLSDASKAADASATIRNVSGDP